MSYQLHITKIAERDIDDAADYIEYFLKNSIVASEYKNEGSSSHPSFLLCS